MIAPREEQIRRLAETIRDCGSVPYGTFAESLYNAGVRIPDPPVSPPAPTVVVSEEVAKAYDDMIQSRQMLKTTWESDRDAAFAAAFPLLLECNKTWLKANGYNHADW